MTKLQTMRRFVLVFTFFALMVPDSFGRRLDNPLAPVKTDHPRHTMKTFYDAMADYRRGIRENNRILKARIEDAVRTLNLSDVPRVLQRDKGREVAILLKEVIDRVIVLDYNKIPVASPDPSVPLLRWRLKNTEIVITRIETGERAGEYLFSPDTVYRAKEFFAKVKHLRYKKGSGLGAYYKEPWLEQHVPEWAKENYVWFPNWKWIGLGLALVVGFLISWITKLLIDLAKKVSTRTRFNWDSKIIEAVDRPGGLIAASGFWFFAIHLLQFDGNALLFLTNAVQLIFCVALVWTAYRLSDTVAEYLFYIAEKTRSPLDNQLVPMIKRSMRIMVLAFGILFSIQSLGYNVMSVLAGLGLGGLAFALAAKDTCANLFGSIMIFMDRPFQVGDWVVVGDSEGTVEDIGFRSTRIRTFYNSLICIPNAEVANKNVDNLGKREYRRVKAHFGLTYDTTPEKMEAFLEGVKNIIKNNENTRKDYYHVVFNAYQDSCLDVMAYFFLKVPDWATELVERQNIYIEVLRLAKEIGVEFAFPTSTLHVETFPEKKPAREQHEVPTSQLTEKARGFGPKGTMAKPAGMGIFVPPYRDA